MRRLLPALLAVCVASAACEREQRRYEELPAAAARHNEVALTPLVPGRPSPPAPRLSPYQENAYGIAEGKRLFVWYNCNGCHAMGGGAIGPALTDAKWIYGAAPEQIHSTIVQGRPNGMPSFGGRIPDQQVWQLVAYIQSLSGNVPKDAAPGRSDHLSAKPPELRKDREAPKQTGHR